MRTVLSIAIPCFLLAVLGGCASRDAIQPPPAYVTPHGAIVLRVSARGSEFTGMHPACGADCVPFYFWHRYNARVEEVISGRWDGPDVRFAHLQHGQYLPAVTNDCYVVLVPAAPALQQKLGVEYVADRILSHRFERDRPTIRRLTEDL